MSIEDDIALLQQVPTFGLLGFEALRILAIGAESRSMSAGTVLFRAGEAADCAYVMESGACRLAPKDSRIPPAIVRRGALLGELALITEIRRPVTATIQEPSLVMRLSRSLFLRMLDAYPEVAERLRQMVLERAEAMAGELAMARHAFWRERDRIWHERALQRAASQERQASTAASDAPSATPVADSDASGSSDAQAADAAGTISTQ